MSFGELSRMSQIKDRNIYLQTDQLYQPLRNALRKSTVSQSLLFSDLKMSRVGRNMRSLSPAEAEIIKRNLYIPVNKELVPTRNIQKVMGKKFTAVDVNERVREPLTPDQFTRMRHGTTEEIIYEIKDQPSHHHNVYTSREQLPSPLFNHSIRNLRQSKVEHFNNHTPFSFIHPNRQSHLNLSPQPTHHTTHHTNITPTPNRNSQFNLSPTRLSQSNHSPNRSSNLNINIQPTRNSQLNRTSQNYQQGQIKFNAQPNRPSQPNLVAVQPPAEFDYNQQYSRQNAPNIYTTPPPTVPIHTIIPHSPTHEPRQSMGNRQSMGFRQSMVNRQLMGNRQITGTRQSMLNRQQMVNRQHMGTRQSMINRQMMGNRQLLGNRQVMGNRQLMGNRQANRQSMGKRQSILMDRSNQRITSPGAPRNDSSKQILNKSMTSIAAIRNDLNTNEPLLLSQAKSGTDFSSKLYDFRGSKISDKTNRLSKRSKDEYKYNLFSALDEAGNTNCRSGCFNSNEIVASKREYNPWK